MNQLKRPTGLLAGLCFDALVANRQRDPADQRNWLNTFEFKVLDLLSSVDQGLSSIQSDMSEIERLLRVACSAALTQEEGTQIRAAYERAVAQAFPTTEAVLKWFHAFDGITNDHSLASINPSRVRELEAGALHDPALKDLLHELRSTMGRVKNLDDSQAFRQAFENYGEAVMYELLSRHFATTKIKEQSSSTPDFRCQLSNGKTFFVELKTFDLVDAAFRAKEILHAGIAPQIELEEQQKAGNRVSIAEHEVDPYQKAFTQPSCDDTTSLIRVIEVLIDKTRNAFKASQFAQGPTFALALCDRLILPGGKHGVAPYYYERGQGGNVVSGALWQACFGRMGTPIFRLPDFEGKSTLEGHLTRDGLLVDTSQPFHSGAIIFAETQWQEDGLFGLYDANWALAGWTPDDTKEVMHTLCTATNDHQNSFGYHVAMT
jgi:hypothetical protein